MRASSGHRKPESRPASSVPLTPRTLPLLGAVLFLALALPSPAQDGRTSAAASQSLEAAFRLPVGGRPLVPPLLDGSSPPDLVWTLSEDGFLYALSEEGKLITRVAVGSAGAEALAIDPFGRAVLCSGSSIEVYTRLGSLAWKSELGSTIAFPPCFGSDGRLFVATESRLVCLNPSGLRLWTADLPSAPRCPPGTDGRGDAVVGLPNGLVLTYSPFGQELSRTRVGGELSCLVPLASGGDLPCLAAGLEDGRVVLLDSSGAARLQIALGGGGTAAGGAAVAAMQWDGAALIVLDRQGRVSALSSAGERLWTAVTACIDGRLTLFPTRVVVASRGRVLSLSSRGEIYREANIVHAAAAGVVSPAGFLFSAGEDWILAAYRFERPLGEALRPTLPPYPKAGGVAEAALQFDPTAGDADRQLFLLADIEKRLRSGTIGTGEGEAAAYCAAVALGQLDPEFPDSGPRQRSDPLPRSRACALLGLLGSPDCRGSLCTVLAQDSDPAVRAAACEALGSIGVDPGGQTAAAFLTAALRPIDGQTAVALMAALERLTLSSGTPPSAQAVRALLALAQRPYAASVRDRAAATLGRLAGSVGQ